MVQRPTEGDDCRATIGKQNIEYCALDRRVEAADYTLSVWAMSRAHRSANERASAGEVREAKKATKGLSSNSLFPDKSIKKAQALQLLIPY